MGIATKLEQGIDSLLTGFITSKSQALCSTLIPLALTGVTIYIILTGYLITTGKVSDSLTNFLWKALKIAFVGAIALGGGMYQSYIVEAILGIQGIFTQAFSNTPTLGGLIDNVLKPYQDLSNALWLKAFPAGVLSLPSFSILCAACMVLVAQFCLFTVGMGLYLLSKIALALVLCVGPFFVMCALFPVTQKFTESWVGQALNYVFLNVLIGASISMLTSFVSQFASHINANQDTSNIIASTTELLLASAALVIVMLNVNQIASALCGGLSISGIGRDAFNYVAGRKQKDDDNDNKKSGQSNSNTSSSNNGTQPTTNNTSSNPEPSSVNSISATQSGNTLEKPPIYDSTVQDQIKNGTFGKD